MCACVLFASWFVSVEGTIAHRGYIEIGYESYVLIVLGFRALGRGKLVARQCRIGEGTGGVGLLGAVGGGIWLWHFNAHGIVGGCIFVHRIATCSSIFLGIIFQEMTITWTPSI